MSNKIKDNLENYEIKTSSREILNRFYQVRDSKVKEKKKNSFFYFKIASSLLVAASLIFAFVKLIGTPSNKNSTSPNVSNMSLPNGVTLIEDDKSNHVAFQVLSGVELLDFIDNDATTDLIRTRRLLAANENQFKEIVDVYDKASDLISNIDSSEIDKKVYQGNFEVNGTTYPYKMEINSEELITIYYDGKLENDDRKETETEFHGEIHYSNNTFYIKGEKEESNNESEFEVTIFIDEHNYIEIEQEVEGNEFEYQYLIHEKGKKKYEIDYSNEKNIVSLEIRDNKENYYFVIDEKEDETIIHYQAFVIVIGSMTLEVFEDKKVYTEVYTLQKIEKNKKN